MNELKDKHIFLTGAARGIGATCARQFVAAGAKVLLVDRDEATLFDLARELNAEAEVVIPQVLDITDRTAVNAAVDKMVATWGRVDALVNNAGITRDALTAKMTEEAWDAVINVNLKAPMICTQAVFPHMKEQQNGVILNASSVSALGNVGQANYAASKSGLIGMTKTWALEFARYNIRVNAVAPGFTNTEMVQAIPEEVKAKIVAKVPLRRLATTDEIAAVYRFLASDSAAFITGQVLYIDGGLTCGF
ncbi:MAG: 3-oxoacyl-ACP reductase FabG [Candidatus Sericytochromatia bacterium]|nr:3-oxoacyl-ACP reductase FabG [Candidatus Sericytochromatia bacterium]